MEASNWPVRTSHGVVRVNLKYEQSQNSSHLILATIGNQIIDKVIVRLPSTRGFVWQEKKRVQSAQWNLP